MKVLLIAYGETVSPMGLQAIHSYLVAKNHAVEFVHLFGDLERLGKIKTTPDFIGISCYTMGRPMLGPVIMKAKLRWPSAKIVLGGRHFHEDVLQMDSEKWILEKADHIVIGEGEYAMEQILSGCEDQIIHGTPISDEDFQDLSLPSPQFMADHMISAVERKRPSMLFSRGCPYACHFCSESRKVLRIDPDRAAWHVSTMEHAFGWTQAFINDDIFGLDMEWLEQFRLGLKSRDVKMRFTVFIHGKTFDAQRLDLFRQIGVSKVSMGVESGDNDILKRIGKTARVEDYLRIHEMIAPHDDIVLHCLWMIGHPGETLKTLEATWALSRELGTDGRPFFGFAIPFPGSVFWRDREQYGKILTYKWGLWTNRNVVFVPHGLTEKDLRHWHKRCWAR